MIRPCPAFFRGRDEERKLRCLWPRHAKGLISKSVRDFWFKALSARPESSKTQRAEHVEQNSFWVSIRKALVHCCSPHLICALSHPTSALTSACTSTNKTRCLGLASGCRSCSPASSWSHLYVALALIARELCVRMNEKPISQNMSRHRVDFLNSRRYPMLWE